jgi:hypothetical protein
MLGLFVRVLTKCPIKYLEMFPCIESISVPLLCSQDRWSSMVTHICLLP